MTLAERIELLGISKGEKPRIRGTLSPAFSTTPQSAKRIPCHPQKCVSVSGWSAFAGCT